MGWEMRRGRRYYYRKERTAEGRVRSVYVGGEGEPLAHLYAESAANTRRMEAARARIHARTFGPIDGALDTLRASEARVRLWRDAYLVATGHRAHRGQWRRRRGCPLPPFTPWTDTLDRPAGASPMAKKTPKPQSFQLQNQYGTLLDTVLSPETVPAVEEALRAASQPGATWEASAALRDVLATLPPEAFSDMGAASARRAIAGYVCNIDTRKKPTDSAAVTIALTEAEMARHAAALSEPDDSPLVRAACEQAANARALLDEVTARYCRNLQPAHSFKEGAYFEKRLSAAHTRHVRALATVSALRRVEREERRRAKRAKASGARAARDRHQLYAALSPEASQRAPLALPAHAGDSMPRPEDVDVCAS